MNLSFVASNRFRLLAAASVLLAAVAVGVLVLAGAANSKPTTLSVARNVEVGSRTEPIAVTPKGTPVYELSPETAKHLLCTSGQCLSFWPPVKVAKGAKLSKGAGLSGRLGTLNRKGFTQLTLNGHPLYTFTEDHQRGEAHGEGLKSFGGTWHVFREGSAGTTHPTSTTSTTSTAPYGY